MLPNFVPNVPSQKGPRYEGTLATWRLAGWVTAWLGTLVTLGVRLWPAQVAPPLSYVEVEAWWVVPPAFCLVVAALALRDRRLVALGAATALGLSVWCVEWLPVWSARASQPPVDAPSLRVIAANLLAPRPNANHARALLASGADVLCLSEVSTEWWEVLEAEGVVRAYPHHVEDPHPYRHDYMGIALLSRLPLGASHVGPLVVPHIPYAWADLDVGGHRVRVASIHLIAPYGAADLDAQVEQVTQLIDFGRDADVDATILAGDFNVTPTSRGYRRLRDAGFLGAHDLAGRPFATTWPDAHFSFPPVRFDHVFVRAERETELVHVASIIELDGHESDHRGLDATLRFARRDLD